MSLKFKMPPHPIYWHDRAHYINAVREDEENFIKRLSEEFHDYEEHDFFAHFTILERVARNGHVLIKVNSGDWDETFSQKTLSSLTAKDIRLPYNAFSIDLSTAKWSEGFGVVHVAKGENDFSDFLFLSFVKKDEAGVMSTYLYDNETVGDTIEGLKLLNSADEVNFVKLIYKVISIIMYASHFRREPNRVDIRSVKARKTSIGMSYKINEVRLIQPEYALHGVAKGDQRNKSDKERQSHIVRGHWRAQRFGNREEGKTRPVWIAPFWKGSARESATKIVKI